MLRDWFYSRKTMVPKHLIHPCKYITSLTKNKQGWRLTLRTKLNENLHVFDGISDKQLNHVLTKGQIQKLTSNPCKDCKDENQIFTDSLTILLQKPV